MAFSNSWNYTDSFTAANAIALALRRLGVYDPSETINSTEEANALQVLNLIVKEWTAAGADIWVRDTLNLILTSITSGSYTTAGGYALTNYASTALDGDHIASDTTLTVDSISGASNGDLIFIKLADNSIQATTINGAPAGSVITITTGLTGAANDGAKVYFAATTNRYTGVIASMVGATAIMGDTMSPMTLIGDLEYRALPQRTQTGTPSLLYHIRRPTNSTLIIHPIGAQENIDIIELLVIMPIQDLDSTSNNIYVTPEAFNALVWDLAAQMASEYGLSEAEQKRLFTVAEAKKELVFNFNVEDASVIFSYDASGR